MRVDEKPYKIENRKKLKKIKKKKTQTGKRGLKRGT
jgi:hypothetical protein